MQAMDSVSETRARLIAALVRDLEALPTTVIDSFRAMRNPRNTARELATIIERDQALTGVVLRQANSAAIVGNRRIVALSEAIFRIGFEQLRSILTSVSTAKLLERPLEGYGLARGVLWGHSYGAALIAREVGVRLRLPQPEEAFIATLLHDVGQVVLEKTIGKHMAGPMAKAIREFGDISRAEREVLGFDHCYVGGLIIRRWGLPDALAESIEQHHEPDDTALLAFIIRLADRMSGFLGLGDHPLITLEPLNPGEVAFLGLTIDDIASILEIVRGRLSGDTPDAASFQPAGGGSVVPARPEREVKVVAATPESGSEARRQGWGLLVGAMKTIW